MRYEARSFVIAEELTAWLESLPEHEIVGYALAQGVINPSEYVHSLIVSFPDIKEVADTEATKPKRGRPKKEVK